MPDLDTIVGNALQISFNKNIPAVISVYGGLEGVKQTFLEVLDTESKEPLYAFLNPEKVDKEVYEWITTHYIRIRKEKAVFVNSFITGHKNSREMQDYILKDEQELRKTIVIEDFEYPFECAVNIHGDKIAFMNYKSGELVGILIHDQVLASTLKAFYLHYLWKV